MLYTNNYPIRVGININCTSIANYKIYNKNWQCVVSYKIYRNKAIRDSLSPTAQHNVYSFYNFICFNTNAEFKIPGSSKTLNEFKCTDKLNI
jgi:hypothetical protein